MVIIVFLLTHKIAMNRSTCPDHTATQSTLYSAPGRTRRFRNAGLVRGATVFASAAAVAAVVIDNGLLTVGVIL